MREHKWQLLVTTENYEYGGLDFYYWCKGCGTVKLKPGRVDKETLFYVPIGDSVVPNSQECFENVCDD